LNGFTISGFKSAEHSTSKTPGIKVTGDDITNNYPSIVNCSFDEGNSIPPKKAELAYNPSRLLVKIKREAVSATQFRISSEDRFATTGLESLDVLNMSNNVKAIRKAYNPVKNEKLGYMLGVDQWYVFTFSDDYDMGKMKDVYKRNEFIEEATPDYRIYPSVVPNDPYYPNQWGHNNTGQLPSYSGGSHSGPAVGAAGFDGSLETAWDALGDLGSTDVVIGIMDSGVDLDHPDLAANIVAGYDFGCDDSNPDDNSNSPGHGTACAGIAAAVANNSAGIAGVAPGCKIMPLKIADQQGNMYFLEAQAALYYAADNGADIVNMSFGNESITAVPAMNTALQYAYNQGVILIASTGNANNSAIGYPACNHYVIAVGAASPCGERKSAVTCDGESWWGSNYGDNLQDGAGAVDVVAPTILPTTDIVGASGYSSTDYYMYFNGTSCSAPFVAGVCALI
jgi:subtilisin family serine protease